MIEQLGRPGLPFEQFRAFVTKLGITLDEEHIVKAFQEVDLNQDQTLDKYELKLGIRMLLREVLPITVLRRQGLTVDMILPRIIASLLLLFVIFLFLILSFQSLGQDGGVQSVIQSGLTAAAAFAVKSESSRDVERLREVIQTQLEQIMNVSLKRARKSGKGNGKAGP